MTEQELNEKEAKNIDRVISSLKSILAFYESKAKPRRPLESIRWALVVAIELCEKQIAKKPRFVDVRYRHHGRLIADGCSLDRCYECPSCNSHIFHVFESEVYCKYCGQKLDWGNEDDRD